MAKRTVENLVALKDEKPPMIKQPIGAMTDLELKIWEASQTKLKLSMRQIALLSLLWDKRNQLASFAEIDQCLWPDSTKIPLTQYDSRSSAVSVLNHALKDQLRLPTLLIKSVENLGYTLKTSEDAPVPVEVPSAKSGNKRKSNGATTLSKAAREAAKQAEYERLKNPEEFLKFLIARAIPKESGQNRQKLITELFEHANQFVSFNKLIKVLWPNQTFNDREKSFKKSYIIDFMKMIREKWKSFLGHYQEEIPYYVEFIYILDEGCKLEFRKPTEQDVEKLRQERRLIRDFEAGG